MVLLMWCVWGGFLLHILECNYLTVLVKPVYEKPIDTAEDIIEIKKNSLMDILAPINQILSIKTSAFSNILGRASTALSSIVNIKRDIIKHKVEEISDLLAAAVGTQCRTVEVEVISLECTESSCCTVF